MREEDAYATKKLNETLQLLREQMELQEAFFQKMDLGDRLFQQQKLEEALEAYNQALELIPTDNYTLSQAEKINDILREQKNASTDTIKAWNSAKTSLNRDALNLPCFSLRWQKPVP